MLHSTEIRNKILKKLIYISNSVMKMGSDDYFHKPFFTKQSPRKLDASFMDWEDNQDNNVHLSTLSGFVDRSLTLSPHNQSRNFFTGKNVTRNATSPMNLLSSLKISDTNKSKNSGLFDNFYANSGEEYQTNCGSNISKGSVIQHKTGWASDGKDTYFYFQTTGVAYKRNWKPPSIDHSSQPMEIDYPVPLSPPAAVNLFNKSLNDVSLMEVSDIASPSFPDFGDDVSPPSPVDDVQNCDEKENTNHFSSQTNNSFSKKSNHFSSQTNNSFSKKCKILFSFFSIILFSYILFQLMNNSSVETTNRYCFDFEKLEHDLSSNIFGQHLATRTIYDHLKAFLEEGDDRKVLSMSLHGSTGTGKSYTAQYITSMLPEERFLYFSVAKTFKENTIEPNVGKLRQEIQKIISYSFWSSLFRKEYNCPYFVVLDNMEYASNALAEEINEVIDSSKELNRADVRKVIILLLSNTGSDIINNIAQNALRDPNSKRDGLTIVEISNDQSFKDSLDSSWVGKILDKKVVDVIIPFLPLQRSHVEECARRRIQETKASMKEELLKKVVDDFQYKGLFSVLGCKKVSAKVDEITYSNVCNVDSGVTLWDKEALKDLCKE